MPVVSIQIWESWGCRHTLMLMAFLGNIICYTTRVCLSVAIVAMVGTRTGNLTHLSDNNLTQEFCPLPQGYELQRGKAIEGEFDWDEQTQGLALGAFYWGYTLTNIPGGRAAEYLGGRLVFGLGVVGSSLLTIVAPFCAWHSKELFIIIRALAGAFQGVAFPSLATLLVTWVAPEDISKFNSIVYSGTPVGNVVAMSLSGWLCDIGFLGGWPSPFYVFGIAGCLWGIPWFLLIHNRHQDHPRVSVAEINYINRSKETSKADEIVSIPWVEMAKSPVVWSLISVSAGASFGFYMFLSGLPTYLSNILHFDLGQNGLLSALPYICMALFSVSWGALMNWLTHSKNISIRTVRRLSAGAANFVPVISLVALSLIGCDSMVVMVILCFAVSTYSANYCGHFSSYLDIAPNLVGTVQGIANSVGSAMGILAPIVTGLITQGNQTPSAWRLVFLITGAFMFIAVTFYLIFITSHVQPWNEPKKKKEEEETGEASQ